MNNGKGSPLYGLDEKAVDLIYVEQPLHRTAPVEDPLVILNKLDNADKHRLLHPAFVYPGVDHGLDLVQVFNPKLVKGRSNAWKAGQPLEDGTDLAVFLARGEPNQALRARRDAPIGFASGLIGAPRTGYRDLIDRVRRIGDKAVALIDRAA